MSHPVAFVRNLVLGQAQRAYKQARLGNRVCRVFPENREVGALFVHVPKAGGFSIAQALFGKDPWHFRLCDYARITELGRFTTFSVVRHPARRLRSMQLYLAGLRYTHHRLTALQHARDFTEFAELFADRQGMHARHPFGWSQPDYLALGDRPIAVDRLLRLESIDADYAALREHLGLLPMPLPHLNKSKTAGAAALTRAELSLAERLFEREYQLLDY